MLAAADEEAVFLRGVICLSAPRFPCVIDVVRCCGLLETKEEDEEGVVEEAEREEEKFPLIAISEEGVRERGGI